MKVPLMTRQKESAVSEIQSTEMSDPLIKIYSTKAQLNPKALFSN